MVGTHRAEPNAKEMREKMAEMMRQQGQVRPLLPTSHLIYASVKSGSSRDKAFPESSRHIVHNGLPTCGSFAATQTVFQSSNVGDTVADVLDLVFCFCG